MELQVIIAFILVFIIAISIFGYFVNVVLPGYAYGDMSLFYVIASALFFFVLLPITWFASKAFG